MKLWLVNQYAILPSQGGGTRHYDIASELVKKGHDVTVFATSRNHGSGEEVREQSYWQPIVEEHNGVRWVWLKTSPYYGNGIKRALNMVSFFFSFLFAALFATRNTVPRPDIIVGSSVHLLAPLATWCLGRWWKIPAMTEIRDIWPSALVDLGISPRHPGVIVFGWIERFLYRHSSGVITLLPKSVEHIQALGCPAEKIFWVPNGTAMEIVERSGSNTPLRSMYLGTLGDGYALETLIQAGAILEQQERDIHIVLKGQGPRREALAQLIEEMDLKQVYLEPAIPKTQVSDTLGSCDVLIFHLPPSPVFKWGISSNKLFDYLASGRPVLFCCEAGNNPIAESGAGLTITPESPRELAEALLKMADLSEAERLAMGSRGQAFIREHHTIERLAQRFEEAVAQTLAQA